jgi:aspartokinase/homoserine dehydrogenase 2
VILAREMGMSLDLEQVAVESLVPRELADVPVDEFPRAHDRARPAAAARLEKARANGKVLRHVARVDATGAARVE